MKNKTSREKIAFFLCLMPLLVVLEACLARSDYKKACEQDTVEAYKAFLEEHGDKKKYALPAEHRLETLAFQEAVNKNTFSAYIQFLKRFPYGSHASQAQGKAETLRASELGIHLYRHLPKDFYDWVRSDHLPYRLRILSLDPGNKEGPRTVRRWYDYLENRDLFIPMDPQKASPSSPDLTLYIRESMIKLCIYPLTLTEAEVRVKGKTVKSYRIAGKRTESFLIYELFKDRDLYHSLLKIPEEEEKEVGQRFTALKNDLPQKGGLSLEFDISQQASPWDRQLILDYVQFLRDLPLYEELVIYPRGHPPNKTPGSRLFISVEEESHGPNLYKQWRSVGPSVDWKAWNSKWILRDKDYFFKKMTLDMLDLVAAEEITP